MSRLIVSAAASAVPSLIPSLLARPIVLNGLIFFTDGSVIQFTDNAVLYFEE